MMSTPIITNFVAFQIGWFACVLGGAYDFALVGSLVALVIVAWHLLSVKQASRESLLIVTAAGIGTVWDSLLFSSGLLRYDTGVLATGVAPYWIIAMWMLFATTLNVSLRWLHHRPALAALCGLIAGPLAYYAGARLGAVELVAFWPAIGALALGWGVLMPLLAALAVRCDGAQPRTAVQTVS